MPSVRTANIVLRSAHLAAMGILLGGHAFEVPASQLVPALWWTVGTGIVLMGIEAGPRLLWLHQGRGLMTLGKLALVACVPWFWGYRLPLLLIVVGIASVGSHMPARFRYYSILHGKVLRDDSGPGASGLDDESEPGSNAGNR